MDISNGHFSRRQWLQLTGVAALTGPLAGWADENLKARARKNLPLAIFTGVYAGLPVEQAAQRIADEGFKGVVLEYQFADARFDPAKPDWEAAKKIRHCFESRGLGIAGLYGYYNLVAPDPAKRQAGEERMRFLIENWRRLGSPNISTETGSFNAQSEWNDAPENATEKGYQACRAALEAIVKPAEKAGAVISIEPYWKNVASSVERTERLFRDIPSPALKLVMDPCNYFRKADLPRMQPMLKDIFQKVGRQTAIAHAKDVKAAADADDTDLPAAGKGVLDYPLYLRQLALLDREVYLVIEHLTLPDVARARDFVLAQFEKI